MTPFGCYDPILQFVRFAFCEQAQEILTELIGRREIFVGLTHLIEWVLLLSCKLLFGKHKEKGGLAGRKAAGAWEQVQESGEGVFCWLEGEAPFATAW
jgi:hypothetical protein